jgi:hypothetical protein
MACLLTGAAVFSAVAQDAGAGSAAPAGITVTRQAICTNVAGREPVGEAESFSSTVGSLACFTDVTLQGDGTIEHRWYHGDNLVGKAISLTIKGPRWRTHSRKMIPETMAGSWRVDVVDASGTVLSTKSFKVQ